MTSRELNTDLKQTDPTDRETHFAIPSERARLSAPLAPSSAPAPRNGNNAAWLVRLRWMAAAGQLATVIVAAGPLGVNLRLWPLLAIIGLTVLTNGVLHWFVHRSRPAAESHWTMAAVMTIDLISLTGLLYFSGGPENPFALFYLVNVALAALVLPERWSWGLTFGAIGCFASLFLAHVELPELHRPLAASIEDGPTLGLAGLLASIGGCCGVVAYFVTRVTRELRERERELRKSEQQRARAERLEALATLAAGAAHELATPLSTIAVVVSELSRHLQKLDAPPSILDDVALIRDELTQCRTILDRMAGSAGQAVGEAVAPVTVEQLMNDSLEGIHRRNRVDVRIDDRASQVSVRLPRQAVAQALRGVIRNGLDASDADGRIELSVRLAGEYLCILVRDSGVGMSDEVAARAAEPFFTTKEPGRGMGLGLFLTKSVVERLGGSVTIKTAPGQGTTVSIELPQFAE